MTGAELSAAAKKQLEQAGIYNQNELNCLFLAAFGQSRQNLFGKALTEDEQLHFFQLLQRRISGEPLQYLLGRWPFLDFEVKVDQRALIPRPETELLAETCIRLFSSSSPERILDLCSGTGVLAFAMKRAFPQSEVTAVELSADAHALLCENRQLLQLSVSAVLADAIDYLQTSPDGWADLILCNPPYVTPQDYNQNYSQLRYEPSMAFIGGEDGLLFYRAIIPAAHRVLKPQGVLAFEIGEEQAEAVRQLFCQNSYVEITCHSDFSGLDRVIFAKKACYLPL